MRDGTCVSALPLVLFGGAVDVRHMESTVVVDKWLRLSVAPQHAVLVVALKGKLQEIMRAKIEDVKLNLFRHDEANRVITAIDTLMGDHESKSKKNEPLSVASGADMDRYFRR